MNNNLICFINSKHAFVKSPVHVSRQSYPIARKECTCMSSRLNMGCLKIVQFFKRDDIPCNGALITVGMHHKISKTNRIEQRGSSYILNIVVNDFCLLLFYYFFDIFWNNHLKTFFIHSIRLYTRHISIENSMTSPSVGFINQSL